MVRRIIAVIRSATEKRHKIDTKAIKAPAQHGCDSEQSQAFPDMQGAVADMAKGKQPRHI